MKNWLLYYFAIVIGIVGISAAAINIYSDTAVPTLTVLRDGEIIKMTVEDYALGVLLAESETCKSAESKKALGVSARSVGLYLSIFGCKHENFDACDNGSCCISLGKSEDVEEEVLEECISALEATKGLALTLDNTPAMALFCLCNGSGSGNSAEFPYLTAVAEPSLCQTHTLHTTHEYESLTPLLLKAASFEAVKDNSLAVYSDCGNCDFLIIGGKYIKALEFQNALSLPSTEFFIEYTENGITAESFGVGHGYGMSLCGAQRMAEEGYTYEKILINYYPNLILKKLYNS